MCCWDISIRGGAIDVCKLRGWILLELQRDRRDLEQHMLGVSAGQLCQRWGLCVFRVPCEYLVGRGVRGMRELPGELVLPRGHVSLRVHLRPGVPVRQAVFSVFLRSVPGRDMEPW